MITSKYITWSLFICFTNRPVGHGLGYIATAARGAVKKSEKTCSADYIRVLATQQFGKMYTRVLQNLLLMCKIVGIVLLGILS